MLSAPAPASPDLAAPAPPTRERLLRTALRLFAERGYDAVSNREIVDACGLTKGAIYWYFESKDHLFRTVLTETLERWQRRVAAATAGAPGWEAKLRALGELCAQTLESPHDPDRSFLALVAQPPCAAARSRELARAVRARSVGSIRDLLTAGGCPPDRAAELASLVWSVTLGAAVQEAAGVPVARPLLAATLRLAGAAGAASVERAAARG